VQRAVNVEADILGNCPLHKRGLEAVNAFLKPQIEIGSGNVHVVDTPARNVRYSLSLMLYVLSAC
jgi:hypothetical protein